MNVPKKKRLWHNPDRLPLKVVQSMGRVERQAYTKMIKRGTLLHWKKVNPDKVAAQMKRHKILYREEHRDAVKRYVAKDPERWKDYQREYHKVYDPPWREKNKEHIKQQQHEAYLKKKIEDPEWYQRKLKRQSAASRAKRANAVANAVAKKREEGKG